MAKIKSGAWYVMGDTMFKVIGLGTKRKGKKMRHADLYNIEYVGIRQEPIPSFMYADKIGTCTLITKEVADIMLAVT